MTIAMTLLAAALTLPPNGAEWKDTSGNRINAHGGGMMEYGGKWWWYGEDRGTDRTKGEGVHVYSSEDLVTWKDEGMAFRKHDNVGSPVGIGCVIERPKVVRCDKTGRFVMFFHLELADYSYTAAMTAICSAERPEGPFRFHRAIRPNACRWPIGAPGAELTEEEIRGMNVSDPEDIPGGENDLVRGTRLPYVWHYPTGQMSRDMTLYKDVDGKVYHIFASEHNSTLHIAELTDDCLDYTGRWWRMAEKDWTEAPAVFRKNGKYWLVGSGCTGWNANPARLYVADRITGPWKRLANPCRGVSPATGLGPEKTFGCQSTYAIERKDGSVILMFDEWRAKNLIDSRYHWFKVSFGPDGTPAIDPNASDEPVKIILDTDMVSDYDDAGAFACLHAMADAGECEILATLSCTRSNRSVAAMEILNAYYGRPDLPVGCAKGIGVRGGCPTQDPATPLDRGGHAKYVKLAKDYPQWVRHLDSDDAPDANEVYRKVLAAQPDHSVVICSIGFLTNLRRLLETKPDAFSPLDGRALVAKKVKKWVVMACNYPNGKEYNSRYDAESSRIAIDSWPTPIVFSDFQYGMDVYTGRRIAEDPRASGPVKDVFANSLTPRSQCTDTSWDRLAGHPSWDETAVLAAVRGEESYFKTERGTYRMIGKDGDDEWTADAEGGRHLRLVERLPKAEVGKIIDELICRPPRCLGKPVRPAGVRLADPSVYVENGTNFMVGTDGGVLPPSQRGAVFPILASVDGREWRPVATDAGDSRLLAAGVPFGKKDFWAPQLFRHGGLYYFAYTCESHWGLAVAERLGGPYRPHAAFREGNSRIDPYVFFDDDGKAYVAVSDWNLGGISIVGLTDDLRKWKGEPKLCLVNDRPWERRPLEERYARLNAKYGYGEESAAYHANTTVVEGPTLLKRFGKYVLFYSANDYRSPDYCVGVAVADAIFGPWKKLQEGPVLSRDETGFNGTGHGDVFFEGGEMKYVFHVHDSDRQIHPRRAGVIRLTETLGSDGYPRYAADPETTVIY